MSVINSKAEMARVAKVSLPTVYSWLERDDCPEAAKSGRIEESEWLAYAHVRKKDAKKKQTGEHADLKRAKLEKQIALLEYDIKDAGRRDELSRIEYEAKRGLWFSADQVKEFAAFVAAAFDEGVSAVEMATRDPRAVRETRAAFDRIREQLAGRLSACK